MSAAAVLPATTALPPVALPPVAPSEPAARRFAVVCPGFAADRVRRQPWHVADGIARGLTAAGHAVWIIGDAAAAAAAAAAGPPAGLACRARSLPRLFEAGGRASAGLRAEIRRVGPERVFLVTGAFRLARLRRLDLGAAVSLVMASPRLRPGEFRRLGVGDLWRERALLALPLLNALLPGAVLRRGWARGGADDVVYLSPAARSRFAALGLPPGRLLLPQVEREAVAPAPRSGDGFTVGYFGPPLATRGADLALAAFERAAALGLDGRLLLLLRPDGEPAAMDRFAARVARSPQRHRVELRRDMLGPLDLRRELARCDAFLLPFRLTVSEVPLVVIEACLSGRPTIVLDAPGVGDVARRLGGVVAPAPEALPQALLEARSRGRAPGRAPDPAGWTDWRAAAAPLAEPPAEPWAALRVVALVGVDGSGKSFLVRELARRLDAAGVPHRHVWSRFRNYLSKPLLALARLTGHNRKEEAGGVRVGYHDFAGRPWLAWPFLVLQLADGALDAWWRLGRRRDRRLVLADRCLYDTLVDLAVDTGLDEALFGWAGRWLVRRLPAPRLVVVLTRPAAEIAADRPDALLDRHFARRRALYERLARELALPVLENAGSAEAALDRLERLAVAAAARPARGAAP